MARRPPASAGQTTQRAGAGRSGIPPIRSRPRAATLDLEVAAMDGRAALDLVLLAALVVELVAIVVLATRKAGKGLCVAPHGGG